jgi:hypothetical protein
VLQAGQVLGIVESDDPQSPSPPYSGERGWGEGV